MADSLVVGDQMRFSVELIRQMAEDPDYSSILVEVVEIRDEPDGTKMLYLRRGTPAAIPMEAGDGPD